MKNRTKKLLKSLKPKEKTIERKIKNACRLLARNMAKSIYDPNGIYEKPFKQNKI